MFMPDDPDCLDADCPVFVSTGPSFLVGSVIDGAPEYNISFGQSDRETVELLGGISCIDDVTGEVLEDMSGGGQLSFEAKAEAANIARFEVTVRIPEGFSQQAGPCANELVLTWVCRRTACLDTTGAFGISRARPCAPASRFGLPTKRSWGVVPWSTDHIRSLLGCPQARSVCNSRRPTR